MTDGDLWFFDRIAGIYARLAPPADPAPLRAGLDRADGEVRRVLDVGGGTGRAVHALVLPERVVVDASRPMLLGVPPGIGRVRASADALPVRAGAADAVLIVDAFHHLPNQRAALAEAGRVLRPGGVLVIRDFDPTTRRGRLVEAAEHLVRMRSTFRPPDDLTGLLRVAGFEPSVPARGFAFTVVGRKPGSP